MNEERKSQVKSKRKKSKREPKLHRVYCTYFPDDRYYIGYSCKTEKQFEKYYGSSSIVKEAIENNETLSKEVILQTTKRNEAKMQEFLLQWQQRHDPKCLNSMLNIRLNKEPLAEFVPIDWKPK